TRLRARPDEVWQHASSFIGVNRELWPLARMTYPPSMARLVPGRVPLVRTAFRSWILLLGLIPVDFDDITLIELTPGPGFYEVSRLLTWREGRPRRPITATQGGGAVIDETAPDPRGRWLGPFWAGVYRRASRLRHGRLKRLLGGASR